MMAKGNIIDFLKSFAPGGITPIQAYGNLWTDPLEAGDEFLNEYFSNDSTDTVSNPGEESSSSAFDYSQEASDIFQAIKDATDIQNEASQSSADRAMEFSEEQARLAREFNAAQAQKAMDYQTEMFGKRYQMTMEDLRKAGLNPKLVGSLGSPSAPSGVASSASAPEGVSASMSMQNISALAGVLETYMTNVNTLDRKDIDFVQDMISTILSGFFTYASFKGFSTPQRKIGF